MPATGIAHASNRHCSCQQQALLMPATGLRMTATYINHDSKHASIMTVNMHQS
jgi:hypothetical protein